MEFDDIGQSISALLTHPLVQRLLDFMQEHNLVLSVILAVAVGVTIGRRSVYRHRVSTFQNRGEALLSNVTLMNFGPPNYHLMNHVTIQLEDGTTQIDHILVSRFGVFVIETKDYKGWIFANANQANWTQVLYRLKFRFQNPIRQNFRHVKAVSGLLDFLPSDAVSSAVVFTGEAEFKTEVPQGVFSLSEFIEYLREQTVEVMSLNRVQFCVGRLETARLAISYQTDVEHIESLDQRHGGAN